MKLLFDLSSNQNIYDGVTVYALRILKGFKKHISPYYVILPFMIISHPTIPNTPA